MSSKSVTKCRQAIAAQSESVGQRFGHSRAVSVGKRCGFSWTVLRYVFLCSPLIRFKMVNGCLTGWLVFAMVLFRFGFELYLVPFRVATLLIQALYEESPCSFQNASTNSNLAQKPLPNGAMEQLETLKKVKKITTLPAKRKCYNLNRKRDHKTEIFSMHFL